MWTYLEEDGHLRRYAHDSCSSTQECHVGRRKWRIKEGPTITADERLISHHNRPVKGFCHQIPHYGPYADGLPWACYLRPAASSQTYSAASSWTHPVPAPSHCPRPASLFLPFGFGPSERHATGLLPDPGGDYPRFRQFLLLSIFSIARLPFPITPILNSVRPFFISPINICNKLVGPTFGPLFLNLMPGIRISKNLL